MRRPNLTFDANYEVAVIQFPGENPKERYARDERQAISFAHDEGLRPLGEWQSCSEHCRVNCWHDRNSATCWHKPHGAACWHEISLEIDPMAA